MTHEQAPPTGDGSAAPARYVIRAATLGDAAGIAVAHVASWQTAYRGLLPQAHLEGLSVERYTQGWRSLLSDAGTGLVHVAADAQQRVAGFAHTCRSRDDDADDRCGELTSIYLRPELWDHGIGGRLLAAAVAALAAEFDEATLWVLDENSRARAFYERKDWWADGTVRRDTIGGAEVVEVRYRRALHGHPHTS